MENDRMKTIGKTGRMEKGEDGRTEEGKTQRVLFSGLQCLPGQLDLFATDGDNPQPPTKRIEAMNPTEQDYEKLARTVLIARGDDPDEMVEMIDRHIPAWEFESLDADNDCVTSTRDTLDNFRANSKSWREPGQIQEINGGLYWHECQAMRGQRRCELCVVDCGDFRLCYQV